MNADHPPPSNGSPTPSPTYTTLGPGQWPSPQNTPGRSRFRKWLAARWRDAITWSEGEIDEDENLEGSPVPTEPMRPALLHFRSELSRPNPTTTAEPPASPVTGQLSAPPSPPAQSPGDHTCMIRILSPCYPADYLWITSHETYGLGTEDLTPLPEQARKWSAPGGAAEWWAARRQRYSASGSESGSESGSGSGSGVRAAIVRAGTGEVVIELTEEVVGGTSGATGPAETPGSTRP